jgi:hypothetical protein
VTARRSPLRALLRAHLRMTLRGRASQAFAGQLAGRPIGMLWLVAMYVAIGAATVPALLAGADPFTYAFLTQTVTWTLCGVSLTAETGDALFQSAERDVLGHRPVEPRTILLAKVIVLYTFITGLALAVNLVPTIVIARRDSVLHALAHATTVAAAIAVLTAAVAGLYGVAARVVSRERFDDVAAGSQVLLAIVFAGLGLAMPRLVWGTGQMHLDAARPAVWLMPPAWFAALEATVVGARPAGVPVAVIVAAAVLVALPFAGVRPVVARVAHALTRIDEERTGRRVRALPTARGPVLRRWLGDGVERATFRLALAYVRRDRDVRLRLDPSLVTFTLLPLAGLIFDEQAGGHLVPLATVCLLGMLPGVVLEALRISSHPAAAELLAIAPIPSGGSVFHGTRKAAIWHVLPALAVALGLAVAIVPSGVPLAVPGLIAFPTFTLLPGLFGVYVPLSRPKARGQQASANAVLLTVSTLVLAILVAETLRASRTGRLLPFCLEELAVVIAADRILRAVIARRSLTSSKASPSYGAR